MDRSFFWVTAQPGTAWATIDLRQATHYLRDEPAIPQVGRRRLSSVRLETQPAATRLIMVRLPAPRRTRPSSNIAAAAARLSSYSSAPRRSGTDLWCLRINCDNTSSAAAAAVEPSPAFQSRESG